MCNKIIHTCHTLEDFEATKKALDIENPGFEQIKAYIDSIIDFEIEQKRNESGNTGKSYKTMTKSTEYYHVDIAAGESSGY